MADRRMMSYYTLLHNAICTNKNLELIKRLIRFQRDINRRNDNGDCFLHDAIRYYSQEPEVIQSLIAAGADITLKSSKGDTPLIMALRTMRCNLSIVRKLLCPATINEPDSSQHTPLFFVVHYYNDTEMLIEFINKGADIIHVSSKPLTALHESLLAGRDLTFVKEFLKFTDIDFEAGITNNGDNLLFCAARGCSDPKVVCELIKRGGNVLLTDDQGNTALHIALDRNCSMPFAQEFLRNNIQLVTAKNRAGASPLKLALDRNVIRGAVLIKWALLVDEEYARKSICLEKLKYYDTLNLLYQMFLKRLEEMKSFEVRDGVTLLDVARSEFQNPWSEEKGMEQAELDRVLYFKSGSVYKDILNRVKRPVVLKMSNNSRLSTVAHESGTEVTLDSCSSENVFKYLSESDVLSLVVASVVSEEDLAGTSECSD